VTPASEILLLALDVDGTLAARGDEVGEATRDSLHRAVAAGIHVAIATGRRYRTTLRVVSNLSLEIDTVCLGGALVKTGSGRTLHKSHFDPSDFAHIHELARKHGHAIVCHRDSAELGGADFVIDADISWNEPTRSYVELNDSWASRGTDFGHHSCPDSLVIGAFGAEDELRAWHAAIEAEHPGRFLPSLVPSGLSDDWYFELTPRDVSKWTGLCALADNLGIPRDAICAVGDQTNDLPMLREAGMSVAMGNATDVVKETAHWVTAACDEDGVAQVVDRILDR
jgi:Cof subfamily protein (haloacid dehalogenase superfamily)